MPPESNWRDLLEAGLSWEEIFKIWDEEKENILLDALSEYLGKDKISSSVWALMIVDKTIYHGKRLGEKLEDVREKTGIPTDAQLRVIAHGYTIVRKVDNDNYDLYDGKSRDIRKKLAYLVLKPVLEKFN